MKRRTHLVLLTALATAALLLLAGPASAAQSFGIEDFTNPLFGPTEGPITQAGSHPYALKTHIVFNHEVEEELAEGGEPGGRIPSQVKISGDPKNVTVNLPVGVIANPSATLTRCTEAELEAEPASCRSASILGEVIGYVNGFPYRVEDSLYNMVPPKGKPAEFGANLVGLGIILHITGKLRSDGDYGLSAEVKNLLHSHQVYGTDVTLFGNALESPTPLFTLPTSCPGRSLISSTAIESWQEPGVVQSAVTATSAPLSGCEKLKFGPRIEAQPETAAAASPTGLHVDLNIPQESGGGLATANLRDAVVTLPKGMAINPSVADGLAACTSAQIGLRPAPNQRQTIAVPHPLANAFTLEFEGQSTGSLPANASAEEVQGALEALPGLAPGDLAVSQTSGGWVVEFQGPLAGSEAPEIAGTLADNAVQRVTVPNFNNATFNLSLGGDSTAVSASGELTSGSTEVAFSAAIGTFLGEAPGRFAGEAIAGEGIPAETTILKVQGSTLTLSKAATETKSGVALSASLPGNAPDSLVQAALEALPAIGAGNLIVSGGFQNSVLGNRTPYVLTFIGALANPATVPTIAATGPGVSVSSQPPATQALDVATTERSAGAHFSAEAPNCPKASKIGTVEVDTPLLPKPLPGSVYIAAQGDNPFHSLMAIYIAVDDPETGIVVKLAGHVEPDPLSGQLKTTVQENPQLPFEDFKLDFFGGPRAPLSTPPTCGEYKTTTDLTPWSSPEGEDAAPNSSFQVNEGPGGGACAKTPAEEPNHPSFTVGSLSPIAATYTTFLAKFSREPGSQAIKGLNVTLPPGLSAKLAGIPECSEAQIAQAAARSGPGEGALEQQSPSCPAASEVGSGNVAAGSGAPVYVTAHAYLAGPYKGAPLSLAVITPALAGPFDLGTVVVRAAIYVNPETAQVSIKSDPIPTILDGIPLDVRSVAVSVSRHEFTLNPTNCNPMAITGTAFGESSDAALTSPFQVGACAGLGFKPKLALKLKGGTKRNRNPALKARRHLPQGRRLRQHRQSAGHPVASRSSSTTPTSRPSAPGSSSPPSSARHRASTASPKRRRRYWISRWKARSTCAPQVICFRI